MKIFFLGTYSKEGVSGLLQSSYAARLKATSSLFEKVGGQVVSMHYLQGQYDVLAELEVDCVETAAGIRSIFLLSGSWDDVLLMPSFDIDKAIQAARTAGVYAAPGKE